MLLRLPCDAQQLVLAHLRARDLLAVLATSPAWAESDDTLWRGLAARRSVSLPEPSARPTRAHDDLRRTFLRALRRKHELRALTLHELWSSIWGGDAAAKLRTAFEADDELDASAPLAHHGGATLLHIACRRGRLRCVKELIESRHAVLDAVDEGHFTPLASAAWAGHATIVRYLVGRGADRRMAGVPPMSSSCGGRGPFTALEWASRKRAHHAAVDQHTVADQFAKVARVLEGKRESDEDVGDST